MEPDVILKNFNSTFATWEKELNNYSLEQLCKKPNPESWSLGEPYIHLIGQTLYYNIEQIKICISTNENENGEKSAEGKEVFLHNSFPDQKIKAPSPEFETVHQPNSIEEIREALSHIKNLMTELESKFGKNPFKGKQNIRVYTILMQVNGTSLLRCIFVIILDKKKGLICI